MSTQWVIETKAYNCLMEPDEHLAAVAPPPNATGSTDGREDSALPPPVYFFGIHPKGDDGKEYLEEIAKEKGKQHWQDLMKKGLDLAAAQEKTGRVKLKKIAEALVREEGENGRKFFRREYDKSSPSKRKETELKNDEAIIQLQKQLQKKRSSKKQLPTNSTAVDSGGITDSIENIDDTEEELHQYIPQAPSPKSLSQHDTFNQRAESSSPNCVVFGMNFFDNITDDAGAESFSISSISSESHSLSGSCALSNFQSLDESLKESFSSISLSGSHAMRDCQSSSESLNEL